MSETTQRSIAPLAMIVLGCVWLASERAYLPHVDDLFMITWAKTVAEAGSLPVHALKRFLATPDFFAYSPRLHILAMAAQFKAFGANIESVLGFRAITFALSALAVAVAAVHKRLSIVALFFPAALCLTMLHTGLRFEGTALALLLGGFALLWTDEPRSGRHDAPKRIVAKSLIILAPLAASSALAYGAAFLIVSDLRDLTLRRRGIGRLAIEGVAALAIGIFVLGTMVGFDYGKFVSVFASAGESNVLFGLTPMRLLNGVALLAAAFLMRRIAQEATFPVAAVGLGSLFSLVLHNKISISVPLTWLSILLLADAASHNSQWRRVVLGVTAAVFAAMSFNQVQSLALARPSPEAAAAVRAFAEQARTEKRILLVDEIAAIHGLRLDLGDAYAWTWSLPHPGSRPLSVEQIGEGESWIVSTYTIHGWLRSKGVAGFPEAAPASAEPLRGLPCLIGRNSCRLPAMRWSYYLVERRDGVVNVRTVP